MFEYRGYIGTYKFYEDDGMYHGEVKGLAKDVVHFSGVSEVEIEKEFRESVDDYLALKEAMENDDGTRYPIETVERLMSGENPVSVYRDFHNFTVPKLSEATGISENLIINIESGVAKMTEEQYTRISFALNVDPEDLIPWKQE
ncbi:type II toxin-antitoxin system HicB family antitoxin [Thalassospira sp. A3_1]|uniref:type II toxin-antitoxin system HicB family antitoxin n=1 Tax=Thalassospira sp. A3_1 TaxID=2821088 RepID=UPI001ADA3F68|nr:type II toxin-antitoxin system HicB family antitoxin [Thalassospira sp. A3_1]MBO9508775.1 helix-turn-helix domain-containing protein [Thalassospira sp. A3_1]